MCVVFPWCMTCQYYISIVFSQCVCVTRADVFLVFELVFRVVSSRLPQPYPVFFTDVVQLKAPGMGPDSAEHLEILEEFGPCAAPASLQTIPHTCTQGKECEVEDGCVFVLCT